MYNLVIDVEATCCNDNSFPRTEMEIIEIGAVLSIATTKEIVATYSAFIKPEKHMILTDFCKELTSIKQKDVDNAPSYKEGVSSFFDWIEEQTKGRSYIFYSWGDFDKNIMSRQCVSVNVKNDYFFDGHINAKKMFADVHNLKRQIGVFGALTYKGMRFEGTQHRALDDSININRIINTII